ncbi:MAG: tetratricopeptide repeat protein [Cyanobacteria bacterium REEB67]|nr:tetratricopeptide repeat protein [Cyanobacteria bacterium REEB67]
MSGPDSPMLLYLALALSGGAALSTAYVFYDSKRRLSGGENLRSKNIEQLKSEIAALKREHVQLNETVSRFRAQSLAGISETITETIDKREAQLGLSIKESMEDRLRTDVGALSRELDLALEAVIERLGRLERQESYDARADLQTYARRLEQVETASSKISELSKNISESLKNMKVLSSGQVIDRFLSSLDDPEERLKCLLASFDSVADSATLGKLAVAYPNKNSWTILKELSEHGVVSEVAAWAMIAGARLSAAAGDGKAALQLYSAARHSFVTCGGNQDGLFVVNSALARTAEGANPSGGAAQPGSPAEGFARDAMANIFALRSNSAQSTAPLQLAEFYQRDERLEVAATLLMAVSELYAEIDTLAYQASIRVVENLGHILLTIYQTRVKNLASEQTFGFASGAVANLKVLFQRCQSLGREARVGLLLAILHIARASRDSDAVTFAALPLLELCQQQEPGATETTVNNFAGPIFSLAPSIYESILLTLDALELTRKKASMPLLKRLTAAFLDINSLTRASSCGAKLVDCALESYGDAAAETVEPIAILANIYRRMLRLDLVEECYRQILEIQYKVYSSESEEIVETMINLSDVCRLQNDIGQADIFMESAIETGEALVIREQVSDKLQALLKRARASNGSEDTNEGPLAVMAEVETRDEVAPKTDDEIKAEDDAEDTGDHEPIPDDAVAEYDDEQPEESDLLEPVPQQQPA